MSGQRQQTNWIVILTFNCLALTRRAMKSCLDQDIPTNVLVVDGGSTDGSVQWLRTLGPRVQLLHLPKTAGVSIGWNRALSHLFDRLGVSYALVANNDTMLRKDCYRRLIEDGGQFVTCVGTSSGALFPGGEPSGEIRPHPDFSCFLIRAGCWNRIGNFDEVMRIYCSDGDYHLRMQKAGIGAYCLDLPFYHEASGTLKNIDEDDRLRVLDQAQRDREAFAKKWNCEMGSPEYYSLFQGETK